MSPSRDEPDEPVKRDLRFTARADQGVSIDRDLSGQGHLARGSNTRMSNIRFSVQAQTRDYLDPELAALHVDPPASSFKRKKDEELAKAEAPVSEPAPVPVVPEVVPPQSVLSRFGGTVRRWMTGH